ncbi:AraC family transcriptional regulator [Oenococcus sicerae]|uniref:AraC family transcriptional regulator n=1 Tax=Oenococcus sicerae TaxID=2203724 RepID=A0ABX5QKS0_9LACO|nr:AraC family transcriptional regulator [Oenococcus sicerae]QAS69295.1 AraC family transcriptional regulator [Oenococcus sicerae]
MNNILKDSAIHGTPLMPLAVYDQVYLHGGLAVPYHWHEEWEWIWVEKGNLSFTINEQKMIIHENDLVLIGSRSLHEIRSLKHSPSIHHAIVFSSEILKSQYEDQTMTEIIEPLLQKTIILDQMIPANKNQKYRTIFKKIVNYHTRSENDWYFKSKICILQLINLFFSDGFTQKNTKINRSEYNEQLYNAISYIHENYAKKIFIKKIADQVGLSEAYFIRKFKLKYDLTPLEYINNFRLYKASKMLNESSNNITEICFACGFNSTSYFIKTFKDQFGVSPKKYRDINNKKIN